jgi:hypothetical protein
MRQIFRTWSTNQTGAFTPIEVLAVTPIIATAAPRAVTKTPGTGRTQPALVANSSSILSEKETDSAQAIRMPIALLAQRR